MKILNTIALTVIFSVTLFAAQGFAQSETITASGTVLSPLSVVGTNLDFGTEIFPGLDEEVLRTATGAAQFDITGEAEKEITATFTLPTELSDGTNSLPITFSTTDGGHATASTDQASATGFDPNSALTTTLDVTNGTLSIWLGGTVSPSETQVAGTYSADITLDTIYTGN